jgi:hypothetical protein
MRRAGLSRLIVALAVLLTLPSWSAATQAACSASSANRIIAVGDVHGSFDGLVEILTDAGLIDGSRHWKGGDATLVQVGDLLDRGVEVRRVMDLLMRLQRESRAAGGRVICLLGNHEAMNLLGIHRDVNPQAYATFAGPKSEVRQEAAWKQQVRVWEHRVEAEHKVMVGVPDATKEKWMKEFPPGSFEYIDALGPDGAYGKWLRTLPVAVILDGTLFMHAGLSPAFKGMSVAEMDRKAKEELEEFEAARAALMKRRLAEPWASIEAVSLEADLEVQRMDKELSERQRSKPKMAAYIQTLQAVRGWKQWVIGADDGPLWTRKPAEWDESEHAAEMLDLIAGVGAKRMVVGHTPQASGDIEPRFADHVFVIDTGMLKTAFDGRPSALELCGETATAIYPGETQRLVGPGAAPRGVPATPPQPDEALADDPPATPPPPAAAPTPPARAPPASHYQWLDVDGNRLPFQDDASIEHFLATARVVSEQELPVGVTKPFKVVLEEDGVRAHAAFKYVDEKRKYVSLMVGGRLRVFPEIRDYYLFDCAAYHLDRLLGLGRFPPTVPRRIGDKDGTITLWLEQTLMEKDRRDRSLEPPDPDRLEKQRAIMYVFDNIAGNTDSTNVGNALIDRWWRLWYIDCSRCFVVLPKPLTLETVTRCERHLWKRLNEVTDEEIRTTLQPYLNRGELNALIKRKAAVVAHINALIKERGEAAVLYDLPPPLTRPADW